MDFTTRVVAFLAQLGYTKETPDSIAAACKGNLKHVWEFLLNHARPRADKTRVECAVREWHAQQEADSEGAARTARAAALRARLRALRGECSQMERTLVAQQDELRLQARAVVQDAGEALLAEQEQRDAELMVGGRPGRVRDERGGHGARQRAHLAAGMGSPPAD
jgi:hypothetical protein